VKRRSKHTLLSGRLLDLGGHANTDKTVVGLELLHGLVGVVDESEASGLATTVLGAETEDGDLVLVGLVELGQLLAELILGDVGTVGVEDITGREERSPSQYMVGSQYRGDQAVPAASAALLPSTWFAVLCLFPMEKRVVEHLRRRFLLGVFFPFTHGGAMLNVATECDDESSSFFSSRHRRRL
jgi:hypothetical protein